MQSELVDFIESVKDQSDRVKAFDEAKTIQYILMRVLHLLGWHIFDEVIPEYVVEEGKVDLAIQRNGQNLIFIEAKRVGASLEDHQDQLLKYAFSEGVELGVLTSGVSWWLYLPLAKGSWEQRRFFAIDLLEQDSSFVAENLIRFLESNRVVSGEAIKSAEEYRQSRQRKAILRKTIPVSWNKLITEPDELLMELIIETTESLSGYRADQELVAQFLARNRESLLAPELVDRSTLPSIQPDRPEEKRQVTDSSDFTGTKPVGFSFDGETYEIEHWISVLYKLCQILYEQDPQRFVEASLSLKGRKRPYFTRDPNELRTPYQFEDTDIYMETNLSASSIYLRIRSLLALFDYDPDTGIEIWIE